MAKRSNAFEDLIEDSKKRLEKEKQLANQQHKIENVKAQEGSLQLLFKKFEKEIDRAFAQTIDVLDMVYDNGKDKVKFTQEPGLWRHLEDAREVHAFLKRLGYSEEEETEEDMELCETIALMMDGKLSRRNLLVFLSNIEKLHQTWMAP